MNFQKSALASAITLATFATTAAAFDASSWEVSGFVKNETAALQKDGTFHGQRTSMTDNGDKNDSGDVIKFENTAKLFINGDLAENAALHAELNFVYDTEATPNDYQGHMNYSQNDYLRELYVDTMVGDTEVRVGKQQVVWGTADGIKLLDIINPTDYREFAQNTMEDSRIPVWMLKTDTYVGDSGSLQFIVSQAEENKIAGLNASGDQGNPFIMKGVDTITGKVNGFYNVAPALSEVAATFNAAATGGGFTGGAPLYTGLTAFAGMTVDYFAQSYWDTSSGAIVAGGTSDTNGKYILNNYAQGGTTSGDENANSYVTNLVNATSASAVTWDPTNATSAFEYMPLATFATFNTFTKADGSLTSGFGGMTAEWKKDYSDTPNIGGRYKGSLDNGLNFSVNYFNHYSSNPNISLSYHDPSSGALLTVQRAPTAAVTNGSSTYYYADTGTSYTRAEARAAWDSGTATSILLKDGSSYYGRFDPSDTYSILDSDGEYSSGSLAAGAGAPVMRFTEKAERVSSFGASFDYTVDSAEMPVVIRGEFLYDKGDLQPVVDKYLLAIGDLTNALTMQEADYFKYVIGADVTVLTNMLVSGQFIQMRNLDYVNEPDSCTTSGGYASGSLVTGSRSTIDCGRYTGDMATLHLTNGLQKAQKNKEFYSLFLSKPFGPNQLGRWNNIFMFEEGGGKWNRFDVEYSFSDELVGSFELNNYWGDVNTQFGQMEDSSNIQVGLKYLF